MREEYKIVLFTHDIMTFIPALMQSLRHYGEVAGYKTNESNTMMLSGKWPPQLDGKVKFHWSKQGFRYFGMTNTLLSSQILKPIMAYYWRR